MALASINCWGVLRTIQGVCCDCILVGRDGISRKRRFQLTNPQRACLLNTSIAIFLLVTASVVGQRDDFHEDWFNYKSSINLTQHCSSDYISACVYRQLIYRASFSLVVFYMSMAVLSVISDYVHRSFWLLKIFVSFGVFYGSLHGSNAMFAGWAQACRVMSACWLVVQGFIALDFFFEAQEQWLTNPDEAERRGYGDNSMYRLYIGGSALGMLCTLFGLVSLYMLYSSCIAGLMFVVITVVFTCMVLYLSLTNSPDRGLLTPSFLLSYTVYMCWYSLLSQPRDTCNPTSDRNGGIKVSLSTILC